MKRNFALLAATALLGASLVGCADPMAPRAGAVSGETADRTSPGTAPGADPSSVVGETQAGEQEGQEGQQGTQ